MTDQITVTLPKDRYDELVEAEAAARANKVCIYRHESDFGPYAPRTKSVSVSYSGEDEAMREVVEFAAEHLKGSLPKPIEFPVKIAALTGTVADLKAHIREQRRVIGHFNRGSLFRTVPLLDLPPAFYVAPDD